MHVILVNRVSYTIKSEHLLRSLHSMHIKTIQNIFFAQ